LPTKEEEEQHIKRMADLLRQGTTLTDLACPACASPLFRLRNKDLWCTQCQKKVVVLRKGEDSSKITGSAVLNNLEATLMSKIENIRSRISKEENIEELEKLNSVLSGLLKNLEKIRKTRGA